MTIPPFNRPLPHATRSQVFNALFAFIQQVLPPNGGTWRTFSQMLQDWDDTPPANQPAIYLHRGPNTFEQKHSFGVTKLSLRASVWVYFRTDGLKTANTYPDQLTDDYLDKFEQLFQTDPLSGPLTLGGLVHHCWIDGTVVFDSGVNDNQAIIVIPITILL